MQPFDYHAPGSLTEALALVRAVPEAKLLAGGMTLLPAMKFRLAQPRAIVDLKGVTELAGIRAAGDHLVIGARVRHAEVAASAVVRAAIPALAALAGGIGDPQVRNRGTLGGSIANNDPAADYPAALVALDATILTDRREIAAEAFFTGMFETALAGDEIVVACRVPHARRAGYAKFPNPASRYAIVGVMVAEGRAGVRVAVTGAAPCVFRAVEIERALGARFDPGVITGIRVDAAGLNSDLHASAAYRAHLVTVMAGRAVASAG